MKFINRRFIFTFALLIAANGCDFFYRNAPFVPIPPQEVSGPIEIGSDWVDIVPPQPLKPYGDTNWLAVGIEGYDKNNYSSGDDGKILNLADGRQTKIEAYLFDDKGESYELQIDGIGGGVLFYRKRVPLTANKNAARPAVAFPTDRVYTKLRIRSEIPLRCAKIEWIGGKPQ